MQAGKSWNGHGGCCFRVRFLEVCFAIRGHAMKSGKKVCIDKEKCVGCGACIRSCPRHAIRMQPGWFSQIDEKECIGCGICISLCHRHAPKWKRS